MKDILEIIKDLLPVVIVAVTNATLTTVSTQGIKKFFDVELKGDIARGTTIIVASLWCFILVIHYGGGTVIDFLLVLIMTFLGATGIYEVLVKKQ